MGQNAETSVKVTKNTKAYKWCHRCCTRFDTEQLRSKHLLTCDPWELDKAEHAVKTYLPEVKNDIPPRIRFKDFHAVFDAPCWVTFDYETYREGDRNVRIASFAYAAMGSDVYTVPPEHRYRMFLDRGVSQVDSVVRGIRSLMELWADIQLKSKYAPKHALTPHEEEQFLEAQELSVDGALGKHAHVQPDVDRDHDAGAFAVAEALAALVVDALWVGWEPAIVQ